MSTPAPVIFTKMVTRGKPQQKEPLPEEIPLGKQKTAKRAKKVAAPKTNNATIILLYIILLYIRYCTIYYTLYIALPNQLDISYSQYYDICN